MGGGSHLMGCGPWWVWPLLTIAVANAYSSVPNRRVGRNKRAGGKILRKTLNVQDGIDVQGEHFLENQ